jgi:propanediol utilization protein
VHLTEEAVWRLFGEGASLRKIRELSQPGEFLAEQRVKLVTPRGELRDVAVLGPLRKSVQVELSRTDCRALGVNPPVNLSGNMSGAGDVCIVGGHGIAEARGSVIVARAHAHLRPEDARMYGLSDGDHARVEIKSGRPVTLNDVIVRVRDDFSPAVHIDFDEANACMLDESSVARIYGAAACALPVSGADAVPRREVPEAVCEEALITEALAMKIASLGANRNIAVASRTIITPSAKDVFSSARITVERI